MSWPDAAVIVAVTVAAAFLVAIGTPPIVVGAGVALIALVSFVTTP